jgi:hypothetical protein
LVGRYAFDTVEECVVECETGNRRRNTVVIDTAQLREDLQPKTVTPAMVFSLVERLGGQVDLDPGEKELLAYALTLQDAWIITSPDKAAIRAGNVLGIVDRFISLEELAADAGQHPSLRDNYTTRWLVAFRTQVLLG